MKKTVLFFIILISLYSCDVLEDVAKTIEENAPLTEQEVVKGLKEGKT